MKVYVLIFLLGVHECYGHTIVSSSKKTASAIPIQQKTRKKKSSVRTISSVPIPFAKESRIGFQQQVIFEQEITHRVKAGDKMRVTKLRRSGYITKDVPMKVCV